jgi:hypothetical protein
MLVITNYHSALRVSALVCALVLVFQSGLVSDSTAVISYNTQNHLANSIGASASVQPTELSKFTAALTKRDKELSQKEASLNEREIAINLSAAEKNGSSDSVTYILSSILFILLVLILLNYTLDYLREKEQRSIVPV